MKKFELIVKGKVKGIYNNVVNKWKQQPIEFAVSERLDNQTEMLQQYSVFLEELKGSLEKTYKHELSNTIIKKENSQ